MRVFGKLNLFLNVAEAKGGFHAIESVFSPCFDIYDEVEVALCGSGVNVDFSVCDFVGLQSADYIKRYKNSVSQLSGFEDNTAKAARLFCEKFGVAGVNICVKKGIPFLAGMGGSSADAVGVLKCLCEAFGKGYAEVSDIANACGSDLAGMWSGGVNFCTGRGEFAREISENIGGFAVVCAPSFGVSTKEVFAAFDSFENAETFANTEDCLNRKFDYIGDFAKLENSLQKAAYTVSPSLEKFAKKISESSGVKFKMTGSGSGFFTLVRDLHAAETVLEKIAKHCDFVAISRI